jgi:hypothetical protein
MNVEKMQELVDETSLERTTPTVMAISASPAEDVDLQRVARPRRKVPSGLMGLIAATAAASSN